MNRFLLTLLLAIAQLTAVCQIFKGSIVDANTGEPVPFANIVANDNHKGTMSDINGLFTIYDNVNKLTVTCVGYEPLSIVVVEPKINIKLTPRVVKLTEVEVNAANDPVFRIIDSVVEHRSGNNPSSRKTYKYTLYDQMLLTLDTNRYAPSGVDIAEAMGLNDEKDLFAMETVSEVFFKAPNKKFQNVIGHQMSGVNDPVAAFMITSIQSTSFYDNDIAMLSKNYVNPISRSGSRHYFFWLESAVRADNGDSLFTISFKPLRNSNIDGLTGFFTINSDGWAIQNITAEPINANSMYKIIINHHYERTDGGFWFPKQINTIIVIKFGNILDTEFPIIGVGQSHFRDIVVDEDIDDSIFSHIAVNIDKESQNRGVEFWNYHRIDSLDPHIQAAYKFMDSLNRLSPVSFDKALNLGETLSSDFSLPVGPVNINFDRCCNYSFSRGTYLGLGLSTNQRFSKVLEFSGYCGWWLGAEGNGYQKVNNYRVTGKYIFSPKYQSHIAFRNQHKSIALGDLDEFSETSALISPINYKYFFIDYLVEAYTNEVSLSTRFAKSFTGSVFFNTNKKQIDPRYAFIGSDGVANVTTFATTELSFRLRFAPGEDFLSTSKGITRINKSKLPIVWLSYTRGIEGLLGGKYNFEKYQAQLTFNHESNIYGLTQVIAQAGLTRGNAPITELYNMPGVAIINRDKVWKPSGMYCIGSFVTMQPNEFICDRFAALFLSHNFESHLFSFGKFKPEPTLITNIGWGDIDTSKQQTSKQWNVQATSMEKGYFESGLLIDNLLNISGIIKFGLGAVYRYGAYAHPETWQNISWVLTLNMKGF